MDGATDGVEETTLERETSETISSRTKIRRSRLRMLFEDFHSEISNLEEKLDKCTDENGRLKIVNEELRQQLVDNNIFPVRRMTSDGLESNGGAGGKVKSADNGDISTIIKLSNKLQEMVHVNENVTRVNAALRRDLKSLSSEREVYLQDLIKLREENKLPRASPNPYNRFDVISMKEKIDKYEREILQWKNDMKLAKEHITELETELAKYKHNNGVSDASTDQVIHDLPTGNGVQGQGSSTQNRKRVNSAPTSPVDERRKRAISPGTATEALRKLASQRDANQGSLVDEENNEPTAGLYAGDLSFKTSHVSGLVNENEQSTSSHKETVVDPEKGSVGSGDIFSDPHLFPACAKLLQLTKARSMDPSASRTSPTSKSPRVASPESRVYINSAPSPDNRNSLSWNNGMAFPSSDQGRGSSPILNPRPPSNSENRSSKGSGDVEDDITIVLPSSDHNLLEHSSSEIRFSRDSQFHQSPHITSYPDITTRNDHGLTSGSERPMSRGNGGGGVGVGGPPRLDYVHYSSAYMDPGYPPPLQVVKMEDTDGRS